MAHRLSGPHAEFIIGENGRLRCTRILEYGKTVEFAGIRITDKSAGTTRLDKYTDSHGNVYTNTGKVVGGSIIVGHTR